MIDPAAQLQALLQGADGSGNPLPASSRYHGIPIATATGANGRTIVYLRQRFVPPPERFAVLQEHAVAQGDRLDNLAAQYLGDPEQFWRLCDANAAMRPEELTETLGRRIRITLPEGLG
jgi:hypothetical protein